MSNLTPQDRILNHLAFLYGPDQAPGILDRISSKLAQYRSGNKTVPYSSPLDTLGKLDAILITYGDQFQSSGEAHLQTLVNFIQEKLKGLISGVHILPFFPYSSDDGFSVINYKEVDPQLGDWDDINPLNNCCNLMFDAVINHISRESDWFQYYLKDIIPYQDYFLSVDPGADLSLVTRPRAKPLLTEVETTSGPQHVWTTFSPDQIDLNYKCPDLLIDILDVLLFYIQQGARILRLDAIAYIWKEIGTPCIHLPQTHQVIKLMRAVLDEYAPEVILITETNVPHKENINYFGEQLEISNYDQPLGDEAQMVYQFPLAPLTLHTFQTGNATKLTKWAGSLAVPYNTAVFLNFIASHDGIGVRPAEGLLTEDEIQSLVNQVLDHGGQVSYKTNPDGSESVYELNITLFDALNNPQTNETGLDIQRFIASQAVILSLSGIPGIYIHSLFGSSNYLSGVSETGRARSINREKFNLIELESRLADPLSRTSQVFSSYSHYLQVRNDHPAFHPLAPQQIIELSTDVFALIRTSLDNDERVLCLINITAEKQSLNLNNQNLLTGSSWTDLLTGEAFQAGALSLKPYQVLWLI